MSVTYTVRYPDGRTFGPADMDLLVRWACEGRIYPGSDLIPSDGSPARPAIDDPVLGPHLKAPPTIAGPMATPEDAGLAAVIPYRNAPALIGYYTSIASLIPLIGLVAGPAALAMGIAGYRKSRREPHAKGTVHAWIAIVLGGLTTLAHLGVVGLMIFAWLTR